MSTTNIHTPKRPPTAKELVANRKAAQAAAKPEKTNLPAVPDTRTAAQQYIDENAPEWSVGRPLRLTKEGRWETTDDGKPIPEDAEFAAQTDRVWVEWIKFHGPGESPDRIGGFLYEGYSLPQRSTLGDLDESKWPDGLDNLPADPWQSRIILVLQHTKTFELFSYATGSKTGKRAVATLLRHFDRMQRTHPGMWPVVRLRTGSFRHKDARIGLVITPVLLVVGNMAQNTTAAPDTSMASIISDELPLEGGGDALNDPLPPME